jgi:hypothetical protein
VRTEALDVRPHTCRVVLHHPVSPVRSDRSLHRPARVVLHRPEERAGEVLAVHPQVQYPAPLVDVSRFQRTELLAPQSVVEQHRKDRSIPLALLCLHRRRVEEGAGLSVAQRRRLALVALDLGALYAGAPRPRTNLPLGTVTTCTESES